MCRHCGTEDPTCVPRYTGDAGPKSKYSPPAAEFGRRCRTLRHALNPIEMRLRIVREREKQQHDRFAIVDRAADRCRLRGEVVGTGQSRHGPGVSILPKTLPPSSHGA
jgi:hypothetical protein